MKSNKKILIILAAVAVGGVLAWDWLRPKTPEYKTEKVVRGQIAQDVAETGSVKKGESLNLNFKNSGAVAKVDVAKGDQVAFGRILAELDDRQLQVQLIQARANLDLYNLQLEKLRTGAAVEDISIVQSQAQSAQVALENAQAALVDAKTAADQKLNSAYKTATDALATAYVKAYNGYNFTDLLQRTYFAPQDADSISVFETAQKMNLSVGKIKNYSDAAQADGKDSGLDPVFAVAKGHLAEVETDLRFVRAMCEKLPWRDSVSQTYKDGLDLHIGYVVAAQTAFNSAVENIALQKSANALSVNSAQAGVDAAAAARATAAGQLEKTIAPPRTEDEGILEAQTAQARAQIALLELQIADSKLIAPVGGQIAEVNIKTGETISPLGAGPAMVLLPADPYEIVADIYEEEAVNLKVGNRAQISIAAIPDKVFGGYVAEIDPAGKLINGVVYYQTKIAFDQVAPEALKPEMTADVEIIAAQSDDALLVSETALRKKTGGGWFVQVLENGVSRDVDVQIGIRSKGMAEIISGLSEGDEVIIP